MRESVRALPIDTLIPALQPSFQKHPNLIIEAAPGAGKTTRIPPALLHPAIAQGQEVWVLEPRRIAARMSARRVAEELGERLGETVGYQVRFEDISSPQTRLRFLTEGVLTRRLLSNPTLKGVAAVVLDEFHERHLQSDLALALLRRLQQNERHDLKLIVMSATLNAEPIARYLGDCPTLRSEGRQFEVAVEFLKQEDQRPLAEQVAAALKRLVAERLEGDVLVFLPGAAEIRRTQEACAAIAARENLLLELLHGELSTSEQDRVVRPATQRKVILSTNVAETSITIEGIVAVIDSGLARIAEHSPWSGLPTLPTRRISKASAQQRAGRAGRTRPGRCLRLYTEMDFHTRPNFETPEIQRLDLTGAALELYAAGVKDLKHFNWFESPNLMAIAAAEELLIKLGAIKCAGTLTPIGNKMLRFPLHPRQSRLLLEAEARGVAERGALLAVLLNERDLRARNSSTTSPPRFGTSDLTERETLYAQAKQAQFEPHRLQELSINPGVAKAIERTQQQLRRLLAKPAADNVIGEERVEEQLGLCVLSGYPDRVAKRRASDNVSGFDGSRIDGAVPLQLVNGAMARLASESVVREAEFLIAVEAEERSANRSSATQIRTAVAIQPDWLLDLFPDAIQELNRVTWNSQRERIEGMSQLLYGQLVLSETKLDTKSAALENEVTDTLFDAVQKQGWVRFLDREAVASWQSRIDFVCRTFPEVALPTLGDDEIFGALHSQCKGKRSFAELQRGINLDVILHELFSYEQLALLQRLAPERIAIAGRKNVRINYEIGQAPWIASRMQDFFGMTAGPKIADERCALVLHLLAPNQRPVQITQDLAGFWARTYPQVRRELSRRYPKHSWPENPLSAQKKL